jgi:hypothetical protein
MASFMPALLFLLIAIAAILVGVLVGRTGSSSTTPNATGYTVGPASSGANYTTIQAAVDAASATGQPQTIYVKEGTYTENVRIATSGISIVGLSSISTNTNLVGHLTLESPNLVAGKTDIAVEKLNVTGKITATTPVAIYKDATHVGDLEVSGGGASSVFTLDTVNTSGGTVTLKGQGTCVLRQTSTYSSVLTSDTAKFSGDQSSFFGDIILSQIAGGANNISGGGISGNITVNAPTGIAIVKCNTVGSTFQANGVSSIQLINCIGNVGSPGQTFKSVGGGIIVLNSHYGNVVTLQNDDGIGGCFVNNSYFNNLKFISPSGTTGRMIINETTFGHYPDQAAVVPELAGGVYEVNNCYILSNRFRFAGTAEFTAKNTTFSADENLIGSLTRYEDPTVVSSFNNCVFDTTAPVAVSGVFNFALAASGTTVSLINCAIRNKAGDGVANSDLGTMVGANFLVRPTIGGNGTLEIEGSNIVENTVSLIVGTSTAI